MSRLDCPLEGCTVKRRTRYELLCPPHWHQVPKPIRDKLWRAYRTQGVLSEEYDAARDAVFESLGYDPDGQLIA